MNGSDTMDILKHPLLKQMMTTTCHTNKHGKVYYLLLPDVFISRSVTSREEDEQEETTGIEDETEGEK